MIAIVDNGGSYEDAQTLFVEMGDWSTADLDAAIRALNSSASINGTTARIKWLRGGCESVPELFRQLACCYDEESADRLVSDTPAHLLPRVVEALVGSYFEPFLADAVARARPANA